MTDRTRRRPWRVGLDAAAALRRRNRALFFVAAANLGLAAVFTVLLVIDGRTLLGRNVWTKPWKFAVSIAVFAATLGWLLPSLSLTDRVETGVTAVVSGAMTVEIGLIAVQAGRGVASHFNRSTALDAMVFGVMGATITASSVAVGYVLWRIVRRPPDLAPAYRWGIGLGMALFLLASFEGWLMVSQGGHAVGAQPGGPGLPLLNWSVTGGDLRVAHFIGLHALQVLPLTGYAAASWHRLSDRGALLAVGLVTVLYGGITVVTAVLAIAGHPLVAAATVPQISSAAVAGAILLAMACGTLGLTLAWQRSGRPERAST